MAFKRLIAMCVALGIASLGCIGGCGGSRNSREGDPVDFSLGAGEVNKAWSSSSTELVHDLSRDALYYLDVEDQAVIAIDVASGDDSILTDDFSFEPAKLRLSADGQDLYILESAESAADNDGFPNIARYDIGGGFVDTDFIELADDKTVSDFAVTNNNRVVVASYLTPATGVTPSEQWLTLHNGDSGALIDELEPFSGAGQQLTLNRDQVTLFDQTLLGSGYVLWTVSITNDALSVAPEGDIPLGEGAVNTYEPDGDRIFRSDGTVWDGDEAIDLETAYDSIDFDLVDDRVVMLVDGSSGFIVRYFDIDSLELLSEQSLPAIEEAAGMDPVKLFVDDGELYVVYREITNTSTKTYLLVEFDYPR